MSDLLFGELALVTGSARGLGRAIATSYLEHGARVVLFDANPEVETVRSELATKFGQENVASLVGDITSKSQVDTLFGEIKSTFGPISILVNCAGIMKQSPFGELSEELWKLTHAVNVDGPFFASQAVLPHMQELGHGSIINITSKAGTRGGPNNAAYCSSKGALTTLTKAMAIDLASLNIRVNAIAPALILTEMNRDLFENNPARLEAAVKTIPLNRPCYPADIVGSAVFLASKNAEFITGVILPVDGGATAR